VSLNTKPLSAPLRLFFICWVCYSVAISTVFQASLTTFLIEPGFEEPIRKIEEMLQSKKKFGSITEFFYYEVFPHDSAIAKDAVHCPNEPTCFIWAAVYHNISTVINDLDMEIYRAKGDWTDDNNRPLLCEIEGGVVTTLDFAMVVKKGAPFFKFIDDVLGHIIEGGIFIHIKKMSFHQLKRESKLDVPTSYDTYYALNITHLQTAFYLLMLGYVLAVVCFVTEMLWHCYWSKGRGRKCTFLMDRRK
jgi:hypothetical protein